MLVRIKALMFSSCVFQEKNVVIMSDGRPHGPKKPRALVKIKCIKMKLFKSCFNETLTNCTAGAFEQKSHLGMGSFFHGHVTWGLTALFLRKFSLQLSFQCVVKGQLISKAKFKVFIWTKYRTKIFLYFCPISLKWVKKKKKCKSLYLMINNH